MGLCQKRNWNFTKPQGLLILKFVRTKRWYNERCKHRISTASTNKFGMVSYMSLEVEQGGSSSTQTPVNEGNIFPQHHKQYNVNRSRQFSKTARTLKLPEFDNWLNYEKQNSD